MKKFLLFTLIGIFVVFGVMGIIFLAGGLNGLAATREGEINLYFNNGLSGANEAQVSVEIPLWQTEGGVPETREHRAHTAPSATEFTNPGHTFVHWVHGQGTLSPLEAGERIPAGLTNSYNDHIFFAVWEAREFTVNYNSRVATMPMGHLSFTMTFGQNFPTLEVLPNRTGWDFAGWEVRPVGGNPIPVWSGNALTSDMIGADDTVMLHARWVETGAAFREFTLILDMRSTLASLPGGWSTTMSITSANANNTLPTPTWYGRQATGWFINGTQVNTPAQAALFLGNLNTITVTQNWNVRIAFYPNGGTWGFGAQGIRTEYVAPSVIPHQPSTLTRTGFNHTGWTPGLRTVTIHEPLVTFVAQWTAGPVAPLTYIISFDPNGGTWSDVGHGNIRTFEFNAMPAMSHNPRGLIWPAGRTFLGWTFQSGNANGNHTRVATWSAPPQAQTFTITFNPNGGTWSDVGHGNSRTFQFNSNPAMSHNPRGLIWPAGRTFLGWTFQSGNANGDHVRIANWSGASQAQTFTITFNPNGGTWQDTGNSNSRTFEFSTNPAMSHTPRTLLWPTGRTFQGWTVQSGSANGNHTRIANWSAPQQSQAPAPQQPVQMTYRIRFMANGGTFAGGSTVQYVTVNRNTPISANTMFGTAVTGGHTNDTTRISRSGWDRIAWSSNSTTQFPSMTVGVTLNSMLTTTFDGVPAWSTARGNVSVQGNVTTVTVWAFWVRL
ncbi:MAG: InlB B-repeat-containing protein [Firmicutes bacterium]|nr:InlB B-repeat-containing protein [Bacillota bacterium]